MESSSHREHRLRREDAMLIRPYNQLQATQKLDDIEIPNLQKHTPNCTQQAPTKTKPDSTIVITETTTINHRLQAKQQYIIYHWCHRMFNQFLHLHRIVQTERHYIRVKTQTTNGIRAIVNTELEGKHWVKLTYIQSAAIEKLKKHVYFTPPLIINRINFTNTSAANSQTYS